MTAPPVLTSVEQFLFEVPPYAPYSVPSNNKGILAGLYSRFVHPHRIDGHCPFCHRASTFTVKGQGIPNSNWMSIEERISYDELTIICVRDSEHEIKYWFRIELLNIEKVGQHPSLASVANDEISQYRKYMDASDSKEFHKAIGLAAHGVGVGSFVYLRRVFENLIYKRYKEFKEAENWNDESFYKSRMEDKIALLKDHLPAFLVENRKVYSILSIGIHELKEEDCLNYFEVMKQAIIIIIEDDKAKKDELIRRSTFAKAIASFTPPAIDGNE